jgi:putative FmdB family regulatory protein
VSCERIDSLLRLAVTAGIPETWHSFLTSANELHTEEAAVPTYQYKCTACGHQLDAVQSFSDAPLTVCPECEGSLRKLFSSVGVVFKGSGFYRTDSRSGSTSTDGVKSPSENGSAAAKKTEGGSSGSGEGSSSSTSSDSGSGSGSSGSSGSSSTSSGSSGSKAAVS